MNITLQSETAAALAKVPANTVAKQSANLGVTHGEPLLVAMDAMIRYAKAYKRRYEENLGEDGVLGEEFGKAISGLRALLNGDGAVAMERDITTDSKDNGVIEEMYWQACKIAGLDGDSL